METRPRKRAREEPHDCICPICLEAAVPERAFELPCCNAALAQGEPPQRIHKNCFFAHARASFESKIAVGRSILLMPEDELQSTIRCPRCRHPLAVERRYMVLNGRLCVDVQWPMDGTSFLEGRCTAGAEALPEQCLLFAVFVGDAETPPLDNPSRKTVLYERAADTLSTSSSEPHFPKYNPQLEILGYDVAGVSRTQNDNNPSS